MRCFAILFIVFFFLFTANIAFGYAANEFVVKRYGEADNLFVSWEIMERKLEEKYDEKLQNVFEQNGGCTPFAPKNWKNRGTVVYIDELSPSLSVGLFPNEYPVIIDSTPFTKSQFLEKTNTVTIETGMPITVTVLLFDDRGPQNIQNVTLNANLNGNNFSIKNNTSYIILDKDPPEPVSAPMMYYIKGQIQEDFGQSYRYGSPWASYSLKTHDPDGLFNNVTSSFSKKNHKLEAKFNITFQHSMPKSDLVITSSDIVGNKMICHILDAWEVISKPENLHEFLSLLDYEKISKFSFWFENNFRWYEEGNISKDDLQNAIDYLKSLN